MARAYCRPRLFLTGACHVFALALKSKFSSYPFVKIRHDDNDFAHIACRPEPGFILDAYGWISDQAYQNERGGEIQVRLTTEEEVKSHSRYCWDIEFVAVVTIEAQKWIEQNRAVFDGSSKGTIPGFPRTEVAGIPDHGYRIKRGAS